MPHLANDRQTDGLTNIKENHPLLLNSYIDTDGSFASARREIFPSAILLSFSFPISYLASLYLCHIFHTLVYESKLTAGRMSFQTSGKKVKLNRTCSPSAPGGSETPELFLRGAFQTWKKEKYSKQRRLSSKKINIYSKNSSCDNLKKHK